MRAWQDEAHSRTRGSISCDSQQHVAINVTGGTHSATHMHRAAKAKFLSTTSRLCVQPNSYASCKACHPSAAPSTEPRSITGRLASHVPATCPRLRTAARTQHVVLRLREAVLGRQVQAAAVLEVLAQAQQVIGGGHLGQGHAHGAGQGRGGGQAHASRCLAAGNSRLNRLKRCCCCVRSMPSQGCPSCGLGVA